MQLNEIIDECKLKLTGDVLETELDDATYGKIINSALRELQRYTTFTKIITVPYKRCLDLEKAEDTNGQEIKVSAISAIYRAEGYMTDSGETSSGTTDPMYVSQWQLLSGVGSLYNFQSAMYNYGAWNTLLQIRNTMSTDLAFTFDQSCNKLYINVANNIPKYITIRYIPKISDVSELTSDYWLDILIRLSLAYLKMTVGRIRSRFTQSNALWTQDGETILAEGKAELDALQTMLLENTNLVYPVD